MYKGKFASNTPEKSTSQLLDERKKNNAAEAAKAASRQARAAAPKVPDEGPDLIPMRRPQPAPAPKAQRPAPPQQPKRPARPQPVVQEEAPRRKGKGTLVFYTFYFSFIFLFFVATFLGLRWLHGWLSDYEQAQPTVRCEEVFQALFADPDWAMLYDRSGAQGTAFEGKEAYVAYMEQKTGDTPLTYQETSAGLSGDKKYFVKLGDEKIGWFTLTGETESDAITAIPDWQLGEIELFMTYDNSVMVQLMDGHTANVNGVPLDDTYTIKRASTLAVDYLPAGTTGVRMLTQKVDNLMAAPTVTVVNGDGEEMPVVYDEEKNLYVEQTEANTISDAQKETAVNAVKAYAKFMIEAGSAGEVAKYFDSSSDAYHVIVEGNKWMQNNAGFDFADEKVADYCMYSDELFSAHITMTLNVTRNDGSVKPYPIDTTLFFERQSKDKWLAYDMTNVDVMAPVGEVRLTFLNGKDQIATGFYPTDARELDTPVISVPDGKVFSGWVREDVNAEGKTVLTVVFTPDETGHVTLPSGNVLEPMVLSALFEDAPAGGEG